MRNRVTGRSVERDVTLTQEDGAVTESLDRLGVVRDEDDRPATSLDLRDLREALALEVLVADREHLVEEQHVGVDVRRDGETQSHEHP